MPYVKSLILKKIFKIKLKFKFFFKKKNRKKVSVYALNNQIFYKKLIKFF